MNLNQDDFFQDTYQTGSTRPPKNYGGIIAFLMVLVIFLSGVSTALGLMNIRLFRFIKESKTQETAPVAFSQSHSQSGTQAEDICFRLGFSGQEIPDFWCVYQDLPHGIYITDVQEQSDAFSKGVLPGDILLCLDGTDITTADQLHTLLSTPKDRTTAQVVLYRSGTQIELNLKLYD